MYSFRNDYGELAHKDILKLMLECSNEQNLGYGIDRHTENARNLIKKQIKKNVDIHFLVGGTSCNKIIISHILKPYEAVISVESGHINVHETGAIEATGHKVITVKGLDGKITVAEINSVCDEHNNEHMVAPKMVYISNSTEIGTVYTKSELENIYQLCKKRNLYLFIDGARLGVALTSDINDITINDISNLCDVFYIGGTKNGGIFGEAVVIVNEDIKPNFRYSIKQNGGLLAKGYACAIQFEVLFTNDLYFQLAKHANETAKILKAGLEALGVEFASSSPTNQQFITLDNRIVEALEKNYSFELWGKNQNKTTIRLVTSWATEINDINNFLIDLKHLLSKKHYNT